WDEVGKELGPGEVEFENKGGLVVASTPEGLAALHAFAARQAAAGIHTELVDHLHEFEPHIAPGLPGGVHYPQDAQVQPVLAAAGLLRAAVRRGARVRTGEAVAAVTGTDGQVTGVRTANG
ncbi:FAD-binding oxidoreductase, partial [Streptomyces sp. SID7982]|nr:FAD-binding oxidoreductase [Streptomyces sp. SID7982]